MTKYGIYQKGWLGEDLQNKYAGQNVFDLAGGVSFTIWQNADSEGYMSAVSLSFTSKSMRLTNAAGEFGGFAYDANRQVWKGFEMIDRTAGEIGSIVKFTGDAMNAVGSGIMWLANEIGNAFGRNRVSTYYYDDNLGSSLSRWEEMETITLYCNATHSLKKITIGPKIDDEMDNVLSELFKVEVTKKKYFNVNEPQTAELWQKAKAGNEQALKELFGMFVQSVTDKEDAADKTQRAIDKIMEDAEKGKFGMGISGDKAKELLDILKGGNTAENNRKFEKFRDDFIKEKADEMKKNTGKDMRDEEKNSIKAYLNGLKFMYDNKDTAAVYIMSKSCAIISDYLLAGLTGKLDPMKVSYSDFYKTKFEKGEIGDYSSYASAPVWVRSFGWGNNKPFVNGLNYRETIDGKKIFAYVRPDLYGKDKNISIEYQGITAEELEKVKGDGKYMKLFDEIAKFSGNLNKVYDSLGKVEWYIVQRKENYDDTHFFIMKRVGNEYKLYDHNWLFSRYRWGSSYNRENHYISRYIWYK